MKTKTFSILTIISYLCATLFLLGITAFINRIDNSYNWKTGTVKADNSLLARQLKTNYISQKKMMQNAFILGGSKAGALQPEKLKNYTENDYYNLYVPQGNFRDYGLFVNYLLNTYDRSIQEFILHLSSHESEKFSKVPYIPIQMQRNVFSKIHSYLQFIQQEYLILDKTKLIEDLKKRNNKPILFTEFGARNPLSDLYRQTELEKNPKVFKKTVFSYWGKYETALNNLFKQTVNLPACERNIEELRKIKKVCDSKNVKLNIVIGPTFIGELYKYASSQYIKYLKDIVSICPVWNFSGINDIDLNPYNFINGGHYFYFVGDKMIETIYSPIPNTTDMNAFGILLTKDNIDQYIESQHQKWLKLKAEYEATGTVKLYEMDDPSYLGTVITK